MEDAASINHCTGVKQIREITHWIISFFGTKQVNNILHVFIDKEKKTLNVCHLSVINITSVTDTDWPFSCSSFKLQSAPLLSHKHHSDTFSMISSISHPSELHNITNDTILIISHLGSKQSPYSESFNNRVSKKVSKIKMMPQLQNSPSNSIFSWVMIVVNDVMFNLSTTAELLTRSSTQQSIYLGLVST